MILGKLKFSDISFSTYSKHQMLMLSEHQLKRYSRSQETLGKYLVHSCPNIFPYRKNAAVFSPHSVRNIRNKKCQSFSCFSVLVFTPDNFLEIKLLFIA